MAYIKLKASYITALRYCWAEFCSRAKMSIERAAGYAQQEISWEARTDIREKRYSTDSILKVQKKQERELREWKDDLIMTIDQKNRVMNYLISELENRKFYSCDGPASDIGKKYTLSIYEERIYTTYTGKNVVTVAVDQFTIEGDYDQHGFFEAFKPPKVEFDNWVY